VLIGCVVPGPFYPGNRINLQAIRLTDRLLDCDLRLMLSPFPPMLPIDPCAVAKPLTPSPIGWRSGNRRPWPLVAQWVGGRTYILAVVLG